MADNHTKTLPLAAAVIMLVAGLSSGCGPLRALSTTPSASLSTPSASGNASIIVPEDSLPPLPGVMSGESPNSGVAPTATPGSS